MKTSGLRPNELRIYYNIADGINTDLDEAIEQALKPFGYYRWASGCDRTNGDRDLAFDKKGD